MTDQLALTLPASRHTATVLINGRCTMRAQDEQRVLVVAGLPVHHFSANDPVAAAYAMVFLVDAGFATQREVGRAFGCSVRTIRRHQKRYAEGGMTALATRSGWRPGRRRIASRRVRVIERLKAEGTSNREIARRLGVTEKAIRKQVGSSDRSAQAGLLFPQTEASEGASPSPVAWLGSDDGAPHASVSCRAPSSPRAAEAGVALAAPKEPVSMSLDVDPTDRSGDRALACLGLLDDAAPVFGEAKAVAGAGVLFALPALVSSGIFRLAHQLYGEIGPAFYGLRTTLLTLLLMALWRLQRPEALKERDPAMLGRVLGLDRAPEVKTVRRKLTRLASYQRAQRLGAALARHRVEQRGQLMGFLYVDGHVRVYHGRHPIPKAHVARMRLCMPATTDYWINDQSGEPLFVMTASANAGLVKMLPEVLPEVRALVGERRVTIVFDRGGWSPKLFRTLLQGGFDLLTYRKGKARRIRETRFILRRAKLDGGWVTYRMHDQPVRLLRGTLRLRQVTRLSDDGHQTQVLTSRWDLRDIEVAYRMFERWRQENFFKYMREEFLLDALADHQIEPDDPSRTVPNPQRRALDREIQVARAHLVKLEQQYGAAALDNPEAHRPTMRGFKIAHGRLGKALRAARDQVAGLLAQRRDLPTRVEVRDASDAAVIKLATERKHLTNLVKMVAYQAESDLLAVLHPHYARAHDEGRTLLHEVFHASADLHVTPTELHVTLDPLSSPHRTAAVETLCTSLNEIATPFPGSMLRLRFAVSPPPVRGLAFPGPRRPNDPSQSARGSPKADISAEG
jgi:DNA-binding CsgD family transcriptional regulator